MFKYQHPGILKHDDYTGSEVEQGNDIREEISRISPCSCRGCLREGTICLRSEEKFKSFQDFYPHYINEHSKCSTKLCHVFGTLGLILFFSLGVLYSNVLLWLCGIALAYLCAWCSHCFMEHNCPATFRHPLYSIFADFKMTFELLTGRREWSSK